MSRTTTYTVTCDVDKTTVATQPSQGDLPVGWLNLQGALFGPGAQADNNVDVCPTCMEELAALPAQWQAIIPATPS